MLGKPAKVWNRPRLKSPREVISASAAGMRGFSGKIVDHGYIPSASQLTGMCPKRRVEGNRKLEEICAIMSSDTWLEQQLATELSHSADLEKLTRMEQLKISQAKLRVRKVQEGWEKGFYTPEEVQTKLTGHRQAIARAESEIERLNKQMVNMGLSATEAELLRQELKALRDRNLMKSTFEERTDLVAKLGIKVLPSEDLKSRKIFCRLNLAKVNDEREQAGFAKVMFGSAYRICHFMS